MMYVLTHRKQCTYVLRVTLENLKEDASVCFCDFKTTGEVRAEQSCLARLQAHFIYLRRQLISNSGCMSRNRTCLVVPVPRTSEMEGSKGMIKLRLLLKMRVELNKNEGKMELYLKYFCKIVDSRKCTSLLVCLISFKYFNKRAKAIISRVQFIIRNAMHYAFVVFFEIHIGSNIINGSVLNTVSQVASYFSIR